MDMARRAVGGGMVLIGFQLRTSGPVQDPPPGPPDSVVYAARAWAEPSTLKHGAASLIRANFEAVQPITSDNTTESRTENPGGAPIGKHTPMLGRIGSYFCNF